MEQIPYTSIIGSLMYAQTYTRLDINFVMGRLARYQSSPGINHWKATKQMLRYLLRMKDHILTYKRFDHLEVIRYSYSYFSKCVDIKKSTFGYLFPLPRGQFHGRV